MASTGPDDSFLGDSQPGTSTSRSGSQFPQVASQYPRTINQQDINTQSQQSMFVPMDMLQQSIAVAGVQPQDLVMAAASNHQGEPPAHPNTSANHCPGQNQPEPARDPVPPDSSSSRPSFENISPPNPVLTHPSKGPYLHIMDKTKKIMPKLELFPLFQTDPETTTTTVAVLASRLEVRLSELDNIRESVKELIEIARSKADFEKEYLRVYKALHSQRECIREYRRDCAEFHQTADDKLQEFMAPIYQKIDSSKANLALKENEVAQGQAQIKALTIELNQARKRISELEASQNSSLAQKESIPSTSHSQIFSTPSRAVAKRPRFDTAPSPRGPRLNMLATPQYQHEYDD
jgi:hypothetical protein